MKRASRVDALFFVPDKQAVSGDYYANYEPFLNHFYPQINHVSASDNRPCRGDRAGRPYRNP